MGIVSLDEVARGGVSTPNNERISLQLEANRSKDMGRRKCITNTGQVDGREVHFVGVA